MDVATLQSCIQRKSYADVGNIFLQLVPDHNSAIAIEFLEGVIGSLNGGNPNKRTRVSYGEASGSASSSMKDSKDIDTSFLVSDSVDDTIITLALQIPEDMNLMAFIIGPKGINVMTIGEK